MKGIKSNDKNNVPYTKKYQDHILCSFTYKVVCIDDRLSKPFLLYREKNAIKKFIKAVDKGYDYCKKI